MDTILNGQCNDKKFIKLWYKKPAARWQEALPLGNGRIGAMVYGGPFVDTIELSEITCFSGEVSSENNQEGAAEAFNKARECYLQKDYEAGRSLLEGFIGKRRNYGTNLPVGNLRIKDEKHVRDEFETYASEKSESSAMRQTSNKVESPIGGYARSLTLDNALAEVNYQMEETLYRRTAFVSNPHQIIVIQFTADGVRKPHLSFSLDGGDNPHRTEIDTNQDFLLYGNAYESIHSNGKAGVAFHGRMRLIAKGGILEAAGNKLQSADRKPPALSQKLQVSGTDEILLLLAIDTDFDGHDPVEKCRTRIEAASAGPATCIWI